MAQSQHAAHAEQIHYMPADGRRFPLCGSWRSNWNHTPDPDSATCKECRSQLAAGTPPPVGERER